MYVSCQWESSSMTEMNVESSLVGQVDEELYDGHLARIVAKRSRFRSQYIQGIAAYQKFLTCERRHEERSTHLSKSSRGAGSNKERHLERSSSGLEFA